MDLLKSIIPLLMGLQAMIQLRMAFGAEPPLPTIESNAFVAQLAVTIQDKQMVYYAVEKHDEEQKMGSLSMREGSLRNDLIYDYAKQRVYAITYQSDKASECHILSMEQAETNLDLGLKDNFHFFGGWRKSSSAAIPHIFASKSIFSLGNKNPVFYQQTSLVDGVMADHWATNMTWTDDNDVFTLHYYFTRDYWVSVGLVTEKFPVRLEVEGVTKMKDGTKRPFHHFYDYLSFEPKDSLSPSEFSIPDGISCSYIPDDIAPQPDPPLPHQMSYIREEVDKLTNTLRSTKYVEYDHKFKIMKVSDTSSDIIYFFNSGIRYGIEQGKCTMRAIDPVLDNNALLKGNYVIDNGPEEFSMFTSPYYVHAGHKLTRMMDSYSLSGTVDGTPFDAHFANKKWSFVGNSDKTQVHPLSMELRGRRYNFFNFKPSADRVALWPGKGRLCTEPLVSLDFEIDFAASQTSIAYSQELQSSRTYSQLLGEIGRLAGVGLDRIDIFISPVSLTGASENIHAMGKLLSAPPAIYQYRRLDNHAIIKKSQQYQTTHFVESDLGVVSKNAAALCEEKSIGKFVCRNFDLCKAGTGGYTMYMFENVEKGDKIGPNISCVHYARNVDFPAARPIEKVWLDLTDAVKRGRLVITVGKLYFGQKLTAIKIKNIDFTRPLTVDSKRPITKFTHKTVKFTVKAKETLSSTKSLDDCANQCLERSEYDCNSVRYCYSTGQCVLSDSLPEPTDTEDYRCQVFSRLYTANFKETPGKTTGSKTKTRYTEIKDVNACAKKCEQINTHGKCESFDYCESSFTCFLSSTHLYSLPSEDVDNSSSCVHFSRHYLSDFHRQVKTAITSETKLRLKTVASVSNAEQCAYLCQTGYEGKGCVLFDYCSDSKLCHLASTSDLPQIKYHEQAQCETFTPVHPRSRHNHESAQSQDKQYTGSSFAGLAVGMLAFGIAIAFIVIFVLYRRNQLPNL